MSSRAVPRHRSMYWHGVVWAVAVMVCASTLLVIPAAAREVATPAMPPSPIAIPRDVPVLAYYYIWFNPDSWDRAKIDFPTLGRYSSDDPAIMRQHIEWAKAAGIDGFIVSWKNTDVLTSRLRTLVKISADEDFKLVIIYQGLDVERKPLPASRVAADLDVFVKEFGENPVFDLFGKPLVIWSGTWEFSRDQIGSVTEGRRDRLRILASERNPDDYRNLADLVDGDAYYWSSVDPTSYPGYADKLIAMATAVHERGGLWIAPAAPGFDARLLGGAREVTRENGDMLRTQLDAAARSDPDAIGLISWNEFSENSHIEPSCIYGVTSLQVVAEALGGTAPAAMACGANTGRVGVEVTPTAATTAAPVVNVNAAEATIAVADDGATLPGMANVNVDSSDPTGSGTPSVRLTTITVLIVLVGFIGGCIMLIALRTRQTLHS